MVPRGDARKEVVMFKEMVDVKLKLVKLDVVRDFVFPPSLLRRSIETRKMNFFLIHCWDLGTGLTVVYVAFIIADCPAHPTKD